MKRLVDAKKNANNTSANALKYSRCFLKAMAKTAHSVPEDIIYALLQPQIGKISQATISADKIRLSFFGWGEDKDHTFTLTFPHGKEYERVFLAYTMTSLPEAPGKDACPRAPLLLDAQTPDWLPERETHAKSQHKVQRSFFVDCLDIRVVVKMIAEPRLYVESKILGQLGLQTGRRIQRP